MVFSIFLVVLAPANTRSHSNNPAQGGGSNPIKQGPSVYTSLRVSPDIPYLEFIILNLLNIWVFLKNFRAMKISVFSDEEGMDNIKSRPTPEYCMDFTSSIEMMKHEISKEMDGEPIKRPRFGSEGGQFADRNFLKKVDLEDGADISQDLKWYQNKTRMEVGIGIRKLEMADSSSSDEFEYT